MMNQPDELEQLEVTIDQANDAVVLSKTLNQLSQNKDFQKIIHEGYFEKEAVRLVMAKSNPALQTPEYQAEILKNIDAIGSLRQYLSNIMRTGAQMEASLIDHEQTREAILAEDLEA